VFGISVEGHTDDVPIATPQFPSNWELSSARASGVVRHFVGRGLHPDRFKAIGYAATRPLERNDSPEARARNRRVNLMLETGTGRRP
jgi:chemotaxis protein MotB